MRGQISIIGLFIFLVVFILAVSLGPALVAILTGVLSSNPDPFTIVAMALIIPTIFYALLVGFWNSINSGA